MQKKSENNDTQLLQLLSTEGEKVIEQLFRKHYSFLCKSIYRIIPDEHITEDLAQEVFYELWKKRERIKINTSVKAYLKRAALNKALNYIRDQKIDFRNAPPKEDLQSQVFSTLQHLSADDLQAQIDNAIDSLPERCRLVFVLSRFEDMSYQEIADQLDISIKTVENQISKALKSLRQSLEPFLSKSLLLLLMSFFQF